VRYRSTARRALLLVPIVTCDVAGAAGAAPDPCKVACKAAKQACVLDARTTFATDKGACAGAPPGPERKSCKQAARAAMARAKTGCKEDKLACVAACSSDAATTTSTLPGSRTTTTLPVAGGSTTTTTPPAGSTTTTTLPGPSCGDDEAAAVRGITSSHDAVRANPSLFGHGTSQPAPAPALSPLCYSASVAAIAQAWADGCQYMHNAGRGDLGENIYAVTGTGSATTPPHAVELWSAEAEFFDYANNSCSAPDPPGTCGHYTQVVWRDTEAIGCGLRVCTANSPFPGFTTWTFVVCDYAPPGNVTLCTPGGCVLQKPY